MPLVPVPPNPKTFVEPTAPLNICIASPSEPSRAKEAVTAEVLSTVKPSIVAVPVTSMPVEVVTSLVLLLCLSNTSPSLTTSIPLSPEVSPIIILLPLVVKYRLPVPLSVR